MGTIAGIIDVIPMIIQNLTWDANLSAFLHWIVASVFISNTTFNLKAVTKGIIISLLLLVPTAILVGVKEPFSLVPMLIMTIILGSFLGFFIDKYSK